MIGIEVAGYRLVEQLGKPGGFGTAYRAERNGSQYVVKILRSDAMTVTKERFAREARSLQKVKHPLVAQYVDHGEAPGGPQGATVHYVVMPFEPGRPLDLLFGDEPWPEERAISLALQVLDGLEAIHRESIVHRDLKPANIFLRENGRVLILDFGIAKLLDYTSITQGGAPGTFRYMAPEQALDSVDGRADLYSLGAILYEMLTSRPVFEWTGDLWSYLRRLKEDAPELPSHHNPNVSRALENVVLTLLAKQPHGRFRDTAEARAALIAVGEEPTTTPPREDLGRGPRWFVHLQHNEAELLRVFAASGARPAGLFYGASQIASSRGPLGAAQRSGVPVVIDPETFRFARADFSRTAGLLALPYAPDPMAPLRPDTITSVDEYRSLAESVSDFEVNNGASIVVAPYFYFSDMASPWLKKNLKLLAETRDVIQRRRWSHPLWAIIATDAETLCDDAVQVELLNRYTRTDVNGYLFVVTIDEQTTGPAQLFNYTRTLLRFRRTNLPVVAARVGSFGLALAAAGVTGFSSGMTTLENFSWSYFADRGRVAGGQQRYYLGPLLQNVSVDIARRILTSNSSDRFACSCPACRCGLDRRLSWANARLHLLYTRDEQIRSLMQSSTASRLDRFYDWLAEAQGLALTLQRGGISVKADHFTVWAATLQELVARGLTQAA